MEILPSKSLGHADALFRLILKRFESLEKTVLATLRLEMEKESMLCNPIRQLPVTIGEIRNKANIDKYIMKKNKQTIDQQYKDIDGEKNFSFCNGILLYGERVVIPGALKKENLKAFIFVILAERGWKLQWKAMVLGWI